MQSSSDTCGHCGITYFASGIEEWKHDSGAVIPVPEFAVAFAVLDSKGPHELWLCENCYLQGKLEEKLDKEQMREVHYQFGLEFSYHRRLKQSKEALVRCLSIRKTADALAALACVEDELGDSKAAKQLYRSALQLEPKHFVSVENLRNLLKRDGPSA